MEKLVGRLTEGVLNDAHLYDSAHKPLPRYWLDASRHLAATPRRLPPKLKLFLFVCTLCCEIKRVSTRDQTVKSIIENV